jgi:hypothetical protein
MEETTRAQENVVSRPDASAAVEDLGWRVDVNAPRRWMRRELA